MKARFLKRDFSAPLKNPPVDLAVQKITRSVFGGPKSAEIRATGYDLDLWNLIELLRTPVVIDAPEGDAQWWGMVGEVQATVRNVFSTGRARIQVGVSIDSMSNRVAVAYSTANLDGEEVRGTTSWEDGDGNDYVSQREYGIKELLWTLSSATQEHAEAARKKKLAELRYPQPSIALDFDSQESQATLYCRGWWSSLDWRYCQVPLQLALAYTTVGTVEQPVGDNDVEAAAQGIQLNSQVNVAAIAVYVRTEGAPADTLTVGLYSATAGVPDTELASGTVDAGDLTGAFAWYTVPMGASYLADPGNYFIRVGRSGAQDEANYYVISMDNRGGYSQGELLVFEDPDWNSTAYDMPFQVYSDDLVETTQQIASFVRNYGQFFRQVLMGTRSGINVESYRDGDSTAGFEVLQLMQMGTDNYRRLLSEVDITRRVRIYEEPAQTATPYLLTADGGVAEPNGRILRNCATPVGVWARWLDVIPPSLNTSRLADPAMVFIDEVEYDAVTDRLAITPRGAQDSFDVAKVKDG